MSTPARAVFIRYPNNQNLYEVLFHLIFGTVRAVEAHLQKLRKGKTPPPTPNPPTKPANPPTNPQENPQPNPNTPTNQLNARSKPEATPAPWDP